MKVQLFIPCYVDQFYPQVGIATMELLQKSGCEVFFPLGQTCCGQPMANSGYEHLSASCNENFIRNFNDTDFIVCPSGSCTLHIKSHLHSSQQKNVLRIRKNVFELTEFLTDVLHIKDTGATFPYKVGYHASCHGQRGLHLSGMSETCDRFFSKPGTLLSSVRGIQLAHTVRPDECCGFGGTFSVTEPAVSAKMGKDRLAEHLQNGVEVITGNDMSCLMHLEGIITRNQYPIRVMHIAEILNATS